MRNQCTRLTAPARFSAAADRPGERRAHDWIAYDRVAYKGRPAARPAAEPKAAPAPAPKEAAPAPAPKAPQPPEPAKEAK